jgi:5S rRNA maturation endonuclease (ribonuclease M5)
MEYEINLDQEFHILVVTDFDPHGYKIQEALKKHLETAGIHRVTLERVYLNPEHITPGIIG